LNFIARVNASWEGFTAPSMSCCRYSKWAKAPHVNNVALGKRGRWRSNTWTYPGASSLGSDARRGLVDHPTVKPVEMLVDALLDLTNRGNIVLDPFLGSGSTLIAADKTGRICLGSSSIRSLSMSSCGDGS
jgi:DNA modification methylase